MKFIGQPSRHNSQVLNAASERVRLLCLHSAIQLPNLQWRFGFSMEQSMAHDDPRLTTTQAGKQVNRTAKTILRWGELSKDHWGYLEIMDIGGPKWVLQSALDDCIRRRRQHQQLTKKKRRERCRC
jgi:hypothetical protein